MAARDAEPFKKRLSEAIFGLASRGEPSVLFVVPGHWRGLQRRRHIIRIPHTPVYRDAVWTARARAGWQRCGSYHGGRQPQADVHGGWLTPAAVES